MVGTAASRSFEGLMTPRRRCSRSNLVSSLSNATISPSTMKSSPRRCAASASAISGKVLVMSWSLRVISRTPLLSANARQRSPSSLRSKIQAGSENRSPVSVASSGSSHAGKPPLPWLTGDTARALCQRSCPQFASRGLLVTIDRLASWHCEHFWRVVDRVSTPPPIMPPAPDGEDLRGLARGLRQVLELAARTLSAEAGPSGLARRITGHLGCELTEVVLVSERFPAWEHVNVQRGVDAYLAAHAAGAQWFGPPGGGYRPHEDVLSLLSMPPHTVMGMGWAGPRSSARAVVRGGAGRGGDGAVGTATYGTAAVGPEENTEVVTLGLVAAAAPADVAAGDVAAG